MTLLNLSPAPIEHLVCTRPHPTADATVAEKVDFFREAGYVMIEGALRGEALHATQREFTAGE
eukprot:COSAG01_NODE_6535_length_3616_cov_15.558999_4_plen_63_part_00